MPQKGYIHYYYGNGKGKTTAALGLLIRNIGWGRSGVVVQFLKNSDCGELYSLNELEGVTVLRGHAGGFAKDMTPDQLEKSREMHNQNLAKGIELAGQNGCGILVLDEIGDALMLGLVDRELVSAALECAKNGVEVVITGHRPDEELFKQCDYATRMLKEKHPYDSGVGARRGVEF